MGCVHSRRDCSDIHPNVFRVINIDERGTPLWSGQLEVTETEIVLYREGRDATVWPLKSLRRYGYDNDIFSFESGRRCATGQGIYAFKCRRAGELFSTLQQNINLRNIANDTTPFSFAETINFRPPTLPRPSIPPSQFSNLRINNELSSDEFLRPSNNQMPTQNSDILEITPLNPLADNNQVHVTNVYQIQAFKAQESNNNRSVSSSNPALHSYCNDINRDLAILRNSLKSEAAINTLRDIEDENYFFRTKVKPLQSPPLSPTHSEQYTALNNEDEVQHPYMNIAPSEPRTPSYEINELKGFGKMTLSTLNEENTSYANVALGEVSGVKALSFDNGRLPSNSDSVISLSLVDEVLVNYAVLDIESNDGTSSEKRSTLERTPQFRRASVQKSRLTPQQSLEAVILEASPPRTPIGYSTIDFNKTDALTSVASGADIEVEENTRRTRHDSTALPPISPT